jgi:hypothetical protein
VKRHPTSNGLLTWRNTIELTDGSVDPGLAWRTSGTSTPRIDARLGEVVRQAVEVDELSEDQRRRSRYGQAFRPYQIEKPMVNRRLMSKLDEEIFNCYLPGLTLVIGLLYC